MHTGTKLPGNMGSTPPVILSAKPIFLAENVTLHLPLTRLGKGLGLFILLPNAYKTYNKDPKATLDPEPLQKWAEEGFCVVQIRVKSTAEGGTASSLLEACTRGLKALPTYPEYISDTKFGMIGAS
jgi:carboxymethylenebutenolidase